MKFDAARRFPVGSPIKCSTGRSSPVLVLPLAVRRVISLVEVHHGRRHRLPVGASGAGLPVSVPLTRVVGAASNMRCRRWIGVVRCAGALLGIPAGGSAEGRATIPATTQLTVSLSRGAAFSVTEATDTGRHLGPRTPCTFTVTVRFTPTALARRTVARLLATNPRSRPGDGEVSAALEPSAAYLDFVFETARACAAELTPIETPGAVASAPRRPRRPRRSRRPRGPDRPGPRRRPLRHVHRQRRTTDHAG